jgi:hypothetical protein
MFRPLVTILMVFAVGASSLIIAGCETQAQTDALIGAAAGAAIGQAVGHDTKATVIGGAVGGGAGYLYGSSQDKKAQAKTEPNATK